MKKRYWLAAALALGTSVQANAQSAGSIVLNAGWFHLAPQDSSTPLKANILGTSTTLPNASANVSDSDTGGFSLAYFVTDNISVEGIFGYPPKMNLNGGGSLSGLGKLGSANEWSPTVLLKYNFGKPDAKLRPSIGVGVSYIWYTDVKLSPSMQSGAFIPYTALQGPTTATLSNTFAPVFNLGMTYNFTKHWSVGASLSYLMFSTKANLTTQSALGPIHSETKLHINPIVTFVSVGYRF